MPHHKGAALSFITPVYTMGMPKNPEQRFSQEHLSDRETVIQALREGDTTLLHVYLAERESKVLTREDALDLIVDTAMIYVEAALLEDAVAALDDALEMAEHEGLAHRTQALEEMRESLLPDIRDAATPDDGAPHTDRAMGYSEMAMLPYEHAEGEAQADIDALTRIGLAVPDELRARHAQALTRRKIAQYLAQITDGRARIAALKEINSGNLPPEVLKSDDGFVVEGPTTIQ